MPAIKNMHKEDIKAAVRKRGISLEELSLQHGLNKAAVALGLLKPLPRANRAVADFLGVELHDLWPAWYDQQGHRKSQPKRTRKTPSRHRKK